MLKGLQGEIEEVLGGISLSVGVLKELFHAYDFCCANMKLFFKVPAGLWSLGLGKLGRVGRWAGRSKYGLLCLTLLSSSPF